MSNTQDIKRRIKSIKNTRSVTRAMELVAGAKMRKAQEQALRSRTYSRLAWELIQDLTGQTDPRLHRLLRKSEKGKTGILLMSSNRGLIGAFNANLVRKAVDFAEGESQPEFIALGKKGARALKKRGFTITAEFEKEDTAGSVQEIRPISKLLMDEFLKGTYNKIVVIYMDFLSTLKQKPMARVLLPLQRTPNEELGEMDLPDEEAEKIRRQQRQEIEYLFEPSPEKVLETLIPRMVEMQMYQALLETNASEHSARMVAMKNASDAASDLVDELTLEFNQLRQAAVTKEISEIVGGQLALQE